MLRSFMDYINDHAVIEPIKNFWHWFAINTSGIANMYSNRAFDELSKSIGRELDKVEEQLAWEIGPGKSKQYLFTISSEGNPRLRQIAETMVRSAPELPDWEFYSSKPPRQPTGKVHLPERNIEFDTSGWKFIPLENPENGRLNLVVLDERLAFSNREAALKAVSIYLDELLGEDTVENWIGEFEVGSPDEAKVHKVHDMAEMPDYLYWATHREVNPLKKQVAQLN